MVALRRPLGGLTQLRQFDPHLSDLAGVIVGVKPALYTNIIEDDWPYIHGLCNAFGLDYYLPARKFGFHKEGFKRIILLGRDKNILRQADECIGLPGGLTEWGTHLGYPECCVRAYGDWQTASLRSRSPDIVRWIYANSDKAGPFSFMLNNVANYYSRIDPAKPADRKRYAAMMRIGISIAGEDVAALNVISWHPCTYHCGPSLKKARAIFGFLKKNLPQWADRLRSHLTNPIIYFDKYEFVALRGSVVSPGIVESRGVCPPYSLLPLDIVRPINQGRRIVVKEDGVFVEPEKMRLNYQGKKTILLDFR